MNNASIALKKISRDVIISNLKFFSLNRKQSRVIISAFTEHLHFAFNNRDVLFLRKTDEGKCSRERERTRTHDRMDKREGKCAPTYKRVYRARKPENTVALALVDADKPSA